MTSIISYTQTNLEEPQLHSFVTGEAVAYTHVSPAKDTVNEDCAALIPYNSSSGLLVIADGLGGQPQGHTASSVAIDSLAKTISKASENDVPLREAVLNGIEQANKRILDNASGSATTLAIVEIQNNSIRPFHVGDSMILLTGQRGKIKIQSVAHSPVGYAVEAGLLDADEAIHHEERHLISNVVGAEDMSVEIGSMRKLALHDTIIVASDGLFDNLYINEIIEIIRKGKLVKAAEELCHLAQQRMQQKDSELPCHPDDLTFILFRRKH